MRGFLKSIWGEDVSSWAKDYWEACNAYNSSYVGVCPEDFLECWILFDWEAAISFRGDVDKVEKATGKPGAEEDYEAVGTPVE